MCNFIFKNKLLRNWKIVFPAAPSFCQIWDSTRSDFQLGYSWKRSYELNQNGKIFVQIHVVNPCNASATEIKTENINKNVISDVYSFLVDVQYAISHM